MMISTFVLATALATIPKVPVLDFSKLPAAGGPAYSFQIQLELDNRQKIDCRGIDIGGSGNRDIAQIIANIHLKNEECNKYNDGLRLVILDCAGKKIIGAKVLGNGLKPMVRWMYRPLPPKRSDGGRVVPGMCSCL